LEQTHPQILRLVDPAAIGFEETVGDAQHELRAEDALEIDAVDHPLDRRQNLVGEFHLADAERATATFGPEPTEMEAHHLPERVDTLTARHHRIALEVAVETPEVGPHVELGPDMPLPVSAAILSDGDDAIEHQHGRQGQLCVARPEQLAATAG